MNLFPSVKGPFQRMIHACGLPHDGAVSAAALTGNLNQDNIQMVMWLQGPLSQEAALKANPRVFRPMVVQGQTRLRHQDPPNPPMDVVFTPHGIATGGKPAVVGAMLSQVGSPVPSAFLTMSRQHPGSLVCHLRGGVFPGLLSWLSEQQPFESLQQLLEEVEEATVAWDPGSGDGHLHVTMRTPETARILKQGLDPLTVFSSASPSPDGARISTDGGDTPVQLEGRQIRISFSVQAGQLQALLAGIGSST